MATAENSVHGEYFVDIIVAFHSLIQARELKPEMPGAIEQTGQGETATGGLSYLTRVHRNLTIESQGLH